MKLLAKVNAVYEQKVAERKKMVAAWRQKRREEILRDIAEKKKIEEETRKRESELAESSVGGWRNPAGASSVTESAPTGSWRNPGTDYILCIHS